MASTEDLFAGTLEKSTTWIDDVARACGTEDRRLAYRVTRAVLHTLRDVLGPEVAAHLSAQLPMLIRGVYYEGWDPTHLARPSRAEFLARVETEASMDPGEGERAVKAVSEVLWAHLGEGIMTHVVEVVPGELASLVE